MRGVRRLSVALVLVALVACGDRAEDPNDSDLLPLPDGLTVIADTGAECGAGGDYHCDRAWLVVGTSAMTTSEVTTALLRHLQQNKGWPADVDDSGELASVELPGRRHGYLSPFGDRFFDAENFTEKPGASSSVLKPLDRADEPSAKTNGVVVVIDDCCGDGL